MQRVGMVDPVGKSTREGESRVARSGGIQFGRALPFDQILMPEMVSIKPLR